MKYLYSIAMALLLSSNAYAKDFLIKDSTGRYPRTLEFISSDDVMSGFNIYDVVTTTSKLGQQDYDKYAIDCIQGRILVNYGKSVGTTTTFSTETKAWIPIGSGDIRKEILLNACK